jgi:hypothetical protein
MGTHRVAARLRHKMLDLELLELKITAKIDKTLPEKDKNYKRCPKCQKLLKMLKSCRKGALPLIPV